MVDPSQRMCRKGREDHGKETLSMLRTSVDVRVNRAITMFGVYVIALKFRLQLIAVTPLWLSAEYLHADSVTE